MFHLAIPVDVTLFCNCGKPLHRAASRIPGTLGSGFNEISKIISEALHPLSVAIEHVGSTAIPQLVAKPIIDIDVVHGVDVEFAELTSRLGKLGYYHNGNQEIPDREVFKRERAEARHPALDSIAHHLYVCPIHSSEWQRHLRFRDFLRANEEARVQYQRLKQELAEEANQDRKHYAQLKENKAGAFIRGIIENTDALARPLL